MQFCWILYAKLNVWQTNFNCVFVFALATLNSYIYFCIGNKIGILTDNLLVATYALSCLCVPVSNAIVEWLFSHVTSVFKIWRSCDFECVKTGISAVSFLPVFYAVFSGFLGAQWQLQSTGSSGLVWVFDCNLYRRTQVFLLCIFVPPPVAPLH